MKKLVMLLAVLIVTPAFALTVSLSDNGDGTVDLNYDATGDLTQPRAFAIVVSVNGGAFIDGVTPAVEGESAPGNLGFGIFPGTIDINDVNGHVYDYGTPEAPSGDAGAAGTGIGKSSVVLELGSLYEGARGDGNEPNEAGTLCTISIDCNGAVGDINVFAVTEDEFRGGIVLEDLTSPAITVAPIGIECEALVTTCRERLTPTEQALYDRYVAEGNEPLSWCWQFHCRGDADNLEEYLLFVGNLRIYYADLNKVGESWQKTPETGAHPDADVSHSEEYLLFVGNLSVYYDDLNLLGTYWTDTTAELSDCPTYVAE